MSEEKDKKDKIDEKNAESAENKYLIFSADGRTFSINFTDVKVIIPSQKAEKIPDFPDYAEGTVVYDGTVITVINLRKRFGYAVKDFSDRDCIIVCDGEKNIGLLCDSISGFREIDSSNIQPAPDINEQVNARFISGEFLLDGEPCYIIKPELVIKKDDESVIASASQQENENI